MTKGKQAIPDEGSFLAVRMTAFECFIVIYMVD